MVLKNGDSVTDISGFNNPVSIKDIVAGNILMELTFTGLSSKNRTMVYGFRVIMNKLAI